MSSGAVMKAARTMVADLFRCTECGKPKVEMASDWKGRGNGRSGEAVHTATRFGGQVCKCPPVKDAAIVGTIEPVQYIDTRPVPRTEYSSNCWPCRNCGAGVDERIDTCLLCGYEREKCTTCKGTGVIDSGPHPVGMGEEPCGCYNGYYYPPVQTTASVPVEDPNDCERCGAAPAPKDDDGNFMYPLERAGRPVEAGFCGDCARQEGFRV